MAQKLNFGELSGDDTVLKKTVRWKIPNVLALPKWPDYAVQSPEFSFANAIWVLTMYPYGQTFCESESKMDFMMHRMQSLAPEHDINFDFYLERYDNREFQRIAKSCTFTSKFYGYFLAESFMKYSDLVKKHELIAPDGTLTVVCELHSEIETEIPLQVLKSVISEMSVPKQMLPARNTKVLLDLEELFSSKDGSDVTVKVRGKEFEAHRVILSARSTVFASMLKHDMKEKNTGLIDIKDCDPKTFPDFLHFLYCGSIERITSDNVCSLYKTSDKYDVKDLKTECLGYMKSHISVDTFCGIISLALQHGQMDLITEATDFFVQNVRKIIVTIQWQVFLAENPTEGNELFIRAVGANRC